MPSLLSAEIATTGVSPPNSSGTSWTSMSCCLARSGFAFGRSDLFIATTIGTSAARAWSIASRVCGISPSLAATTMIATSVICAPRARISENASWPGVSMSVSVRPSGAVAW